jgi:hypothetical protein
MKPGNLPTAGMNDVHLEVIVRQMMRWVKVEDIGDTEFLPEMTARVPGGKQPGPASGRRTGGRQASAVRHHQGIAVDRLVHLGRIVPGDDAYSPKPQLTGRWTTCEV